LSTNREHDAFAARFLGTWSYAPPDATGGNLEQVSCAGSPPTFAPRVGSYSITRSAAGRVRVAADDGCEWTLDVRGNTAHLAPAPQSCPAAGTLAFWSLASDGERAFAVMSGTRSAADASCDFLLATGKLTKVR
jgi:hypothetical protein